MTRSTQRLATTLVVLFAAACASGSGPGGTDTDADTDTVDTLPGADTDDTDATPDDAPVCGDGLITGGEACDDGATESDDGCDERCAPERDWVCSGEPSLCVRLCTVEAPGLVDIFGPAEAVAPGTTVHLSATSENAVLDRLEWLPYSRAADACGGMSLGVGRGIDLVVEASPTSVCGVVRDADLRCAWWVGGYDVAVRQLDHQIGEDAPAFVATDDAGGAFTLADHAGSYVVLQFGAIWESRTLYFLSTAGTLLNGGDVSGAPVVVVAGLVEDATYEPVDQAEAAAFRTARSVDARVTLVHDAGARIGPVRAEWAAYGGTGLPFTVVVAPDGRLAYVEPSTPSVEDLRAVLEADAAAHP